MKLAIMQPYLFPYIGYFQLMLESDGFVVYDNIEYTKKGWINRNRILVNGKDEYISFPLKKDADHLSIAERFLADSWEKDKKKMLNKIKETYRKAPYFNHAFPVIETCIQNKDNNLFNFIFRTLETLKNYLGIDTPLIIASSIPIDHKLKAQEKVLAICKACNATTYINPIGGVELYNKQSFKEGNIDLKFLKSNSIVYAQFGNEFLPSLSIIDVMMFNPKEKIENFLKEEFTLQ